MHDKAHYSKAPKRGHGLQQVTGSTQHGDQHAFELTSTVTLRT